MAVPGLIVPMLWSRTFRMVAPAAASPVRNVRRFHCIIIILEGALDFLGYGIQRPTPSWGNMIANGQQIMSAQPEYVLIPSIALLITVAALNMLGDALRERWGAQ